MNAVVKWCVYNYRRCEMFIGLESNLGYFGYDVVVGRKDEVGELDFGDGVHFVYCYIDGCSDNVCFG